MRTLIVEVDLVAEDSIPVHARVVANVAAGRFTVDS
jgi:hypothetical protein